MLFSRKDVADYINRAFEPAWQMVRPVPIVRVDFGGGNVVTRTLHGNIATYVCNADGQALDVLPGIYSPPAYLDSLGQLALLALYVDKAEPGQREARLTEYHRKQAEQLQKNQPALRIVNIAAMSKARIEGGLKLALMPGARAEPAGGPAGRAPEKLVLPPEDLATWQLLIEDTRINETLRRLQIHEHLANTGAGRPEGIVKWLYREVLHADLDDPYLGLGSLLFASYPFQKEDKK